MTDNTSIWPPKEGLCTPTVPRSAGVFSLSYSIHIDAPASLVFDILRDASKYPSWNQWCPRITIHSQPEGTPPDSTTLVLGTSFILHAIMDASKPDKDTPTQLRVSDLSTPDKPSGSITQDTLDNDPTYSSDLTKVYRIAWKAEGSFLNRGLKSERFHEVLMMGDNKCEVRNWEVMGGPIAHTVKWMYKKTLEEKFELWCRDLKKVSEEKAKEVAASS